MINPKDLTCIMVVENDIALAQCTLDSIRKFTNPCPKILICENRKKYTISKCKNLNFNGLDVSIVDNQLKDRITNTSTRHGIGLNKLMKMVNTKYTAIIESDVCLLSKNWFKLDINKYDIKAAHRGKRDIDYWFVCFLLFKTEIFKDMNWRPVPERTNKLYNDTGWAMAKYIDARNARIKSIYTVSCRSGKTKYFINRSHIKTFELHEDNIPIAAHFGRGSDLARVPNGKKLRSDWISICNTICGN